MKRSIYTLLAGVAMMFASCENDLEPYSDPDCRLNFIYYDYFGDQMTTENTEESEDED